MYRMTRVCSYHESPGHGLGRDPSSGLFTFSIPKKVQYFYFLLLTYEYLKLKYSTCSLHEGCDIWQTGENLQHNSMAAMHTERQKSLDSYGCIPKGYTIPLVQLYIKREGTCADCEKLPRKCISET